MPEVAKQTNGKLGCLKPASTRPRHFAKKLAASQETQKVQGVAPLKNSQLCDLRVSRRHHGVINDYTHPIGIP